jgi:hypothetical protein
MLTRRSFLGLLLAAPLMGQISLVNNNTAGTASPYTVTAPTSGNFLAGCFMNRAATTITSISQTNVTWTFVARAQSSNTTSEVWWGVASGTGGTSVTITWAAGTNIAHQISEFSGVDTSSPVDGTATTNTNTTGTPASGNYTSSNANDLLFNCVSASTNTALGTPNSSFNLLRATTAGSGGGSRALGDAYRIVASTNTYSTTWSSGGGNNWSSVLIGFKSRAESIANKIYSYLRGVSRAAFYTFAVASLGWDCRSVIARVREMLVQLKDAVEMALSRIAEMEMVNA